VHGPEDFTAFTDGDILVAKATAPAWTPLFARAAAVVTDGGTLAAHASLIARGTASPPSSVPAMPPTACTQASPSPSTAQPEQ
jgi:phosphohistidine swiveling domain-containing protein